MTGSTFGRITAAFQDEYFAPDPDCEWDDGSVRRTTAQHYLSAVEWSDPDHVTRALRAMARLMDEFGDQYVEPVRRALRRDGCLIDDDGHITLAVSTLPRMPLDGLRDPAAILDNLDRIHRSIAEDPAQAVGSAKELIESTAKTVLLEVGQVVNEKDNIATLISKAQQALALHPSSTTLGPDGSDAVKKILGSVMGVATGVAELRNRGYGTGHGPATLTSRSTPPSRGAGSCSTPSPTPALRGRPAGHQAIRDTARYHVFPSSLAMSRVQTDGHDDVEDRSRAPRAEHR